MPSRKRNKGKERKAKKAEKAEKEARSIWQGWACRGEAGSVNKVVSGIPEDDDHPVSRFMDRFIVNWYDESNTDPIINLRDLSNLQKYEGVWSNESHLEMVKKILLCAWDQTSF